MMSIKKRYFVLLASVILLSGTSRADRIIQARESVSASTIIDKYIQACGGPALSMIKTEIKRGYLVRGGNGQVPLEVISRAPGKWRYAQTYAWGDRTCCGFNGNTAWIQTTDSIEDMDPVQIMDFQLLFDAHAPLKLKRLYPEMSIKGKEKIGEKESVVISAKSAKGTNIDLAFNLETGLLVRAGNIFFEDYREIGSVKRPFRILLGIDQGEEHRQMKMQFTEIVHNVEVDDSSFERPACVLSIVEAPLFKPRKQFSADMKTLDKCVGLYEDPEKKENKFRIFREGGHLFIDLVGRDFKIEMIPESELDYYTRFLGWDFQFMKDDSGKVCELVIRANSTIRAVKIE